MYPPPVPQPSGLQAHKYCRGLTDVACKKRWLGLFKQKPKRNEENLPVNNEPMMPIPTHRVMRLNQVHEYFGGRQYVSYLARGGYGSVYVLNMCGQLKKHITDNVVKNSSNIIGTVKKIPISGNLILKVQMISSNEDLKNIHKETKIHNKLSRQQVTNTFYVGGVLGRNLCWQISSYIHGTSLCIKKITPQVFENIERAIYKLWKNNIFHADLHCENIMISDNGDVNIIDFGRSIVLPDRLIPSTFAQFKNAIYQNNVQAYADKIILKRSNSSREYSVPVGKFKTMVVYSNDVQALRMYYQKMMKNKPQRG